MRKQLSKDDIERRMEEINALPAECLSEEEKLSLAAAEAEDDGTAMTLDEFRKSLEEYSGRLVIRIPRSLHRQLKNEAEIEGVSLNQYMLYKLAH